MITLRPPSEKMRMLLSFVAAKNRRGLGVSYASLRREAKGRTIQALVDRRWIMWSIQCCWTITPSGVEAAKRWAKQ